MTELESAERLYDEAGALVNRLSRVYVGNNRYADQTKVRRIHAAALRRESRRLEALYQQEAQP